MKVCLVGFLGLTGYLRPQNSPSENLCLVRRNLSHNFKSFIPTMIFCLSNLRCDIWSANSKYRGYLLPKGMNSACIKWTFYAVCFTQECMTNHKIPESWSYSMLLVLQEILPAHWAVSILVSYQDICSGIVDRLWLCSGNAGSNKYWTKHM